MAPRRPEAAEGQPRSQMTRPGSTSTRLHVPLLGPWRKTQGLRLDRRGPDNGLPTAAQAGDPAFPVDGRRRPGAPPAGGINRREDLPCPVPDHAQIGRRAIQGTDAGEAEGDDHPVPGSGIGRPQDGSTLAHCDTQRGAGSWDLPDGVADHRNPRPGRCPAGRIRPGDDPARPVGCGAERRACAGDRPQRASPVDILRRPVGGTAGQVGGHEHVPCAVSCGTPPHRRGGYVGDPPTGVDLGNGPDRRGTARVPGDEDVPGGVPGQAEGGRGAGGGCRWRSWSRPTAHAS
jgi:hypothetical protein